MIPECSLGGRAFVSRPSIRARRIGKKSNGPLVQLSVGRANPCHTSKKKQTGNRSNDKDNKKQDQSIDHNKTQPTTRLVCLCVCVFVVGVESSTTREREGLLCFGFVVEFCRPFGNQQVLVFFGSVLCTSVVGGPSTRCELAAALAEPPANDHSRCFCWIREAATQSTHHLRSRRNRID